MNVFLLRHAIALPRGTPGFPNDDRPLSEEGTARFKRSLRGIRALVESVDIVLSSPMVRAAETARMASAVLGCRGRVVLTNGLMPDAPCEGIRRLLREHRKHKRILVVGHEPLLGEFASLLLGMAEQHVDLKKGGICRIDVSSPDLEASGTLVWLVTPKLLRLCSENCTHDDKPAHKTPPLPRTPHRRRGD